VCLSFSLAWFNWREQVPGWSAACPASVPAPVRLNLAERGHPRDDAFVPFTLPRLPGVTFRVGPVTPLLVSAVRFSNLQFRQGLRRARRVSGPTGSPGQATVSGSPTQAHRVRRALAPPLARWQGAETWLALRATFNLLGADQHFSAHWYETVNPSKTRLREAACQGARVPAGQEPPSAIGTLPRLEKEASSPSAPFAR
jgi:hypothetical protein